MYHLARWSSGQDGGLSRRQQGFESPTGHQKREDNARITHIDILVGVDDVEGPPVPIPNTEVKLDSADNTWLETAREDR